MAYTAWSVVFGEQPTAAKWNQLGANDAGFKDGTNIDSLAILNRHIADQAVDQDKIDFGSFVSSANDEYIFTDQSTNSTSFTDLATVGPTATVNIGASGCALVFISCGLYGSTTANKYTTVELSGANSVTAASQEEQGLRSAAQAFSANSGRQMFFSGLNAGSTTFRMKYKTQSGTGQFFARRLTVIPL